MIQDDKDRQGNEQPLWIDSRDRAQEKYCRFEKLLTDTYKKHEIIVFFKEAPSTSDIETVRQSFGEFGIDPKAITIRRCDNCNIPVLLFQASNIHTVINTEGVRAGSGPPSTTVGESYSLNFFNRSPFDRRDEVVRYKNGREKIEQKKDTIVVAVLDTGFDKKLVDPKYLWTGASKRDDPQCYKKVTTGWNFINDTDDFSDDNANRHGSIVSQYIINQFKKSPENNVQIMPLKTHDSNGVGELFGIICAIHFAIAKGAQMINASWGFYYYFEKPIPYLEQLITVVLPSKGILFVTAAGNRVADEDIIAQQIFLAEFGVTLTADQLRNLAIHNFYPAHLSNDRNAVVTVTTTNGKIVSPTQNYSNAFADLGVIADKVTKDFMQFQVPFAGMSDMISGSSFATAIATGLIGAFCNKSSYAPGLKKTDFINFLSGASIVKFEPALEKKYIRKGAITKKRV